jgi:hypothetical protein
MVKNFSFPYLVFFVYLHIVHSLDGVDDGIHLISTVTCMERFPAKSDIRSE